jgi:superfamily I DNA/RNA helicase
MDFDDLLLFAVDLFKNVPEVLGLWRDRFRHVLVDEYQDTNKMQHDLLVLLLGDNLGRCAPRRAAMSHKLDPTHPVGAGCDSEE